MQIPEGAGEEKGKVEEDGEEVSKVEARQYFCSSLIFH